MLRLCQTFIAEKFFVSLVSYHSAKLEHCNIIFTCSMGYLKVNTLHLQAFVYIKLQATLVDLQSWYINFLGGITILYKIGSCFLCFYSAGALCF